MNVGAAIALAIVLLVMVALYCLVGTGLWMAIRQRGWYEEPGNTAGPTDKS